MPKVKVTDSKGLVQSAGTGVTVDSVLQLNGGYAGKRKVVDLDAATYAPTAGESGTIFTFDGTACTVTLPQAAAGLEYTFVCATTAHASSIITTQTADGLAGGMICTTAALNNTNLSATTSIIDSWAVTIDTLTFNGTTKGGLLGTWCRVVAVSATMWLVTGFKVGSGTMVTSAS
jgi:hypothetical protein